MSQKKPVSFQFPKKFLWGVATSAHQIEGGTHNQWSVWELENANSLAKQAEYRKTTGKEEVSSASLTPENYISGKAARHYELYEKDFALLEKMNLNAFRFSIEWSRVEPTEGGWNAEALTHYKQYIASLKARNIEPVMTLFHFTLPVWFAEKGGFEKRGNIKYFVRFAEKVLQEVGSHVRYVITINEPEVYVDQGYRLGVWPPGKLNNRLALKVQFNLAIAHNRVAKLAHKMSRRYRLGVAKNIAYHYAGDDALLSRATAATSQWLRDDVFLALTRRQLDWIGVNYYFSNRYYGYRMHNEDARQNDIGWSMQPENLEFVLERLFVKYNKPLIVTENGVADEGDEFRQWWLSHTLMAMSRALEKGIPLEGYLHWTLFDTFEWSYGFTPKFGLFSVDKHGRRLPRKSAVWLKQMLEKMRLDDVRKI